MSGTPQHATQNIFCKKFLFGKFFPEIVFSLVIKSKRRICKEFFLPIAEEIWLNIVFNSKDIKFFFSLKQLEYEVGFKFSTEISS